MEFLKNVFGDKSLTYAELEAALKDNKEIKLANLAGGAYIGKEKFDALKAEADDLQAQLSEANDTIQGFKDMDIDGIKAAADDYKQKYDDAKQDYEEKLAEMELDNMLQEKLSGVSFSSEYARKGVFEEIKAKGLKQDNGQILGFDDALNAIKEANPNAFANEKPTGKTGGGHMSGGDLDADVFIASARKAAGLETETGKE